jgi:hypothetical protein
MTVQTFAQGADEEADEEATPKKKRKKPVSTAARSLAECRKRGWTAGMVEKWNNAVKIRQDFLGCIDIIALTPDGILAIQSCSGNTGGGHSDHVKKILAEPRAKKWIEAGGRFELWSWAKRGAAGKRKLWTLRVEDVAPALRELAQEASV